MVYLKNGQLCIKGTDQDMFLVVAESNTKFFSKETGVELEFIKDKKGAVNKIVLYQNGEEQEGNRVK
jgi:hypothetical protein